MYHSRWMIGLGVWLIVGVAGVAIYSVETFLPAWVLLSLAYIYILAVQRIISLLAGETN